MTPAICCTNFTGPNDPLAATSFGGDPAEQQAFFDYIDSSELAQYRGGIAARNGDTSMVNDC